MTSRLGVGAIRPAFVAQMFTEQCLGIRATQGIRHIMSLSSSEEPKEQPQSYSHLFQSLANLELTDYNSQKPCCLSSAFWELQSHLREKKKKKKESPK